MSDRWLQQAIEAPGYVLGLPTGQSVGSAQFLANVAGDEPVRQREQRTRHAGKSDGPD